MNINNVEATLDYGKTLTKRNMAILYTALAVSCLMPIITFFIGITIMLGGMEWNNQMLGGIIGGNCLSLLLLISTLLALINNNKQKKKIKLWLNDAIETNAFARQVNAFNLNSSPYQIAVDFEMDGVKYSKLSTAGNALTGYNKGLLKYDLKQILILYSKKYDKVLILKI